MYICTACYCTFIYECKLLLINVYLWIKAFSWHTYNDCFCKEYFQRELYSMKRSTKKLGQTIAAISHGLPRSAWKDSKNLITWPYHLSRFSVIFVDACANLVRLMCSFRILSISASPSHLLLVMLLVPSLLPRSLHHTTELVWPVFCKPSPSASLASSCHTTLHCISSSFPMLLTLCVVSVAMFEPRYLKMMYSDCECICR